MFPRAACKIQNHFLERSAIPLLNHSVSLSLYLFRAGSCECRSSTDSKMGRDSDVAANANGNFKVEPKETHLRVKKLSSRAIIPSRGSAKAAGYDLSSARACIVPARGKALISTDLSIAIPADTYARIAPRSGLAWKHSIDVGAGVIDADYRGPVGVILFNHSNGDFEVKEGDRIAQLILEKIVTPEVVEVEDLDETVRGVDGFGSTGI